MNGIVIYSADWCAPCKTLKLWLDRKGYKYTVLNADEEPYRSEQLEIAGARILPTTLVNGSPVVGLDIPKLSKLLEGTAVNDLVDTNLEAEKEAF